MISQARQPFLFGGLAREEMLYYVKLCLQQPGMPGMPGIPPQVDPLYGYFSAVAGAVSVD